MNNGIANSERFTSKFVVSKETGCWNWIAGKSKGYGAFTIKKRVVAAHRVSYETHKGVIADGMEIDHLCLNRSCVNPEHLEQVTHKENCLRAFGAPAVNARKTHCKNGHELTERNTYVQTTYKYPRRSCRICRCAIQTAYAKRKSHYQGQKGVTGSRL